MLQAVEGGALDLPYFRMKSKLMLDDEFPASFALALAAKDARLVAEAAGRHGADLPGRRGDRRALHARRPTPGYGDEDMAATYRLSRPR